MRGEDRGWTRLERRESDGEKEGEEKVDRLATTQWEPLREGRRPIMEAITRAESDVKGTKQENGEIDGARVTAGSSQRSEDALAARGVKDGVGSRRWGWSGGRRTATRRYPREPTAAQEAQRAAQQDGGGQAAASDKSGRGAFRTHDCGES